MRRLALVAAPVAILAAVDPLGAQSRSTPRGRIPRPAAVTISVGVAGSSGDLGDQVTFTSRGPLVGGIDPGPHLALGVAFPVASTALELRVEAFYNELTGPRNTELDTDYGYTARMATRDREFGAGPVLLWRARPGKGLGPYLMTGAAAYHARLTSAPTYDDPAPLRERGTTVGFSFGAGFEAPLFGRTWALEIRRHVMPDQGTRGAPFLPITIGTRF